MKRSLVVGLGDTDDSRHALSEVSELARVADLKVVVVHVQNLPASAGLSVNDRSAPSIVVGGRAHGAPASTVVGSITASGSVFVVRAGDPDWSRFIDSPLSTDQAIDAIYGERSD